MGLRIRWLGEGLLFSMAPRIRLNINLNRGLRKGWRSRKKEMQISPVPAACAHKRLPLIWNVGSVQPKVLILLLLGQPCVSQQEPKSSALEI